MQKKNSNHRQTGKKFSDENDKLSKIYTISKASFGSVANLQKESGWQKKKVEKFLQTKISYTKYGQFRKKFPRLNVIAHRINEIWSVDVAYMDKLAQHNKGIKYLLIAVDILSRYLRVQPMKALYAKDAVEALKRMIKKKQPEKVWTDIGSEFKIELKNFVKKGNFFL